METAKVGTLNPPIKEENNDSSATVTIENHFHI